MLFFVVSVCAPVCVLESVTKYDSLSDRSQGFLPLILGNCAKLGADAPLLYISIKTKAVLSVNWQGASTPDKT